MVARRTHCPKTTLSVYLRLLRGTVSVVRKSAWAVSKKQTRARQAQACLARVYPFPHDRTAANCDVCNSAKGSVLQIIEEELRHALIEMQARFAAIDKVVAVCIDLHLKLLVGLYQSFRVFRAIAVVYIVVGRTVNEQ